MRRSIDNNELKIVSLNSSALSISSTTPSSSIRSITSTSSALIVSNFSFSANRKQESFVWSGLSLLTISAICCMIFVAEAL